MAIKLQLNSIEQRLVATCYTVEGQPMHQERVLARLDVGDHSWTGKPYTLELTPGSLCIFPDLCANYARGLFERRSVQDYFLGLDDEGHNAGLLRKVALVKPGSPLRELLETEADACAVKIAQQDGRAFGFFGERSIRMRNLFNIAADYVFVHGPHNVAVAAATVHDDAAFRDWFSQHLLR